MAASGSKLHSRRLKWRWPLSRQVTLSIGTLAVLLTVWWTVAALQLISPLFLPPPQQVLAKLLTIAGPQGFMDATLWQHLAASLTRIVLALLAAVVIGIPVGIAMGLSPTVRGILDPGRDRHGAKPDGARHSGSDNRALSSGAAAGLFAADGDLVWYWRNLEDLTDLSSDFCAGGDVGAGGGEKRAAGSHSCRPVAGCQPCAGAVVCHFARRAAGQQVRIRAAQSLGASRAQVLWFVILPGALPEILTGLRIGLGVGWSTLVAAELIAATRGLGFMVQSAGEFLATDVVLAGIAVIAIIAFLLELGLRALQRRLTPWHGEVQ